MAIALVFFVYRNRRIAEHGLRTRRRNRDVLVAANHRIADLVQLALHLLVLHLEIRDGSTTPRTPVDDVLSAVNQAFFIQPHEYFAHGTREILVHGEVFAVPIHRGAQTLHLIENRTTILPLPFPHAFDERLTPQLLTSLAFLGELPFDHHLGCDTRMIGSRQPQGQKAAHAMPAHDDVHLRLVEHVPHV